MVPSVKLVLHITDEFSQNMGVKNPKKQREVCPKENYFLLNRIPIKPKIYDFSEEHLSPEERLLFRLLVILWSREGEVIHLGSSKSSAQPSYT